LIASGSDSKRMIVGKRVCTTSDSVADRLAQSDLPIEPLEIMLSDWQTGMRYL